MTSWFRSALLDLSLTYAYLYPNHDRYLAFCILFHTLQIFADFFLPATKAFEVAFVSETEHTVSASGASFRANMDFKEAMPA